MEPKSLRNWSTKSLVDTYVVYGRQLSECQRLAKTFNFALPLDRELKGLREMPLNRALVVSKLYLDVRRVNSHLVTLDHEIERRRRLVGVM